MGNVVQEATEVIVPLMAGGAGEATKILAEQCGERLAQALGRVLARLRHTDGGAVDSAEVQRTLAAALASGELREADLSAVVENRATIIGAIHAKNVFIKSRIDIKTGSFNA
jgi:uncharacterized protein YoaH (UPF0181 family)